MFYEGRVKVEKRLLVVNLHWWFILRNGRIMIIVLFGGEASMIINENW